MPSNAPLLWRMRHKIGRVWFFLAIGMAALGLFALGAAIVNHDGASIGVGIGLLTGGALLAVGFRRKGKRK